MNTRSITTPTATAGIHDNASAAQKLPVHFWIASAKNAPSMKNEPCATLTTFISPKISESPADIRNSRTPYASPLTSWVAMNSMPPLRPARASGLGRRLDDVADRVDHLVGDAAVDFRDLAGVDVLDRALRDRVEAERPARRVELEVAHHGAQLVLVLRVAVDLLQREVEDARCDVAVLAVDARELVELRPVVGDEFLVLGIVEGVQVVQRRQRAERALALRRKRVALDHEARAGQLRLRLEPVFVVLLDEAHRVGARVEVERRRGRDAADVREIRG